MRKIIVKFYFNNTVLIVNCSEDKVAECFRILNGIKNISSIEIK